MLQEVGLGERSLADYTHIVGRPLIEEIRDLAAALESKRILHVSATAFGGGVTWGSIALKWGARTEPEGVYAGELPPTDMDCFDLLRDNLDFYAELHADEPPPT